MHPIRIIKKSVFYFDSNQVYKKGSEWDWNTDCITQSQLWRSYMFNMKIWIMATSRFQEGATLDECIDIFLQTGIRKIPESDSMMDRLVTSMEPASYERVPENKNEKTFDFIRVYVNLSSTFYNTWEDLLEGVKTHKREIHQMVLDKIQNDRRYKKFGVPINVLKLSNLVLSRHYFLEYIFELKEIETNKSNKDSPSRIADC